MNVSINSAGKDKEALGVEFTVGFKTGEVSYLYNMFSMNKDILN